MNETPTLTYQKAGVDPEKAGKIISRFSDYLKTRPRDPALLAGIGPFAACYRLKPLLTGYEDPTLVTCCDGVGTKAMLALEWNQLAGLGHDLVAMNVNDLLCTGAKPLLFLDYYACGKLDENQLFTLLKSIQEGCELSGCSLAGGETAEMPGLYRDREFDLAGFAVGVVDHGAILGPSRVKAGDRLIALESSGLHSNGYSLVRKVITQEGLRPDGRPEFSQRTWADLLLAPTIIYVSALRELTGSLHAAAHITGGGLFENLPRILPTGTKAVVASQHWQIPELFLWLQKKAGLSTEQLLSTFNCGVGMILVCEAKKVEDSIAHLQSKGVKAREIGSVEAASPNSQPAVVWQ